MVPPSEFQEAVASIGTVTEYHCRNDALAIRVCIHEPARASRALHRMDAEEHERFKTHFLPRLTGACQVITNALRVSAHRFRTLTLHFLPLRSRRHWPDEGGLVAPEHVNGGFYSPAEHAIVVMRYDEYPKVMLHEAIHFCMHVCDVHLGRLSASLKSALRIHPDVHIFLDEAATETLAILCQIASTDPSTDPSTLLDLLHDEVQHGRALMRELARRYSWPGQRLWAEKTNVFSYIFLKTFFLMNVRPFMDALVRSDSNATRRRRFHDLLRGFDADKLLTQTTQTARQGAPTLRFLTRYGHVL